MAAGLAYVNGEKCQGCLTCGVCTAVCPQQAIILKKVRDVVPAETPREARVRTIAERLW